MTRCALPHCERSSKNDYWWWFCTRHWPLVGRRHRKRLKVATRARVRALEGEGSLHTTATLYARAFTAAVIDAIEGAHYV